MEEIDQFQIPEWVKQKMIDALKAAGEAAAILVCKRFVPVFGVCEVGVAALKKLIFG